MNDAQYDEPQGIEPVDTAHGSDDLHPISTASLTLKRGGVETDIVFTIGSPAVVGRFDQDYGPVDVDLGGLEEGQYVSRKHAKFVFDGSNWLVQDLHSSNGTFIVRPSGSERIEQTELADGDEIAFGNARVVFRLSNVASGPPSASADEGAAEEWQDSESEPSL